MVNWVWPHPPSNTMARIALTGGPFDGETAAFVPTDIAAPAQIVWTGWFPWGFAAYLYEWHGEVTTDQGRTDALVYRPVGRRMTSADIPVLIRQTADLWADTAACIVEAFDVPHEMIWPSA